MTARAPAALVLLLLAATALGAPEPPEPKQEPPPAAEPGFERWLWNPRERTATALSALAAGQGEGAVEALETAARVAPADARVRYNAGAGRLSAFPPDAEGEAATEARREAASAAIPHLQAAVAAAPEELSTDAIYDLGTAQLLAGDPAAAVASLADTLRQAPDRQDAKHNLELALRALEEQKRQEQQRQQSQSPSPSQSPQQSEGGDRQSEEGGQPEPEEQTRQGEEPRGKGSPLPNFVDQPSMTAQEAAALLEAVENRERQQRREIAAARAKERRGEEKDW